MHQPPIHVRLESLLLDIFTPDELALELTTWIPILARDIALPGLFTPRQYAHAVTESLLRRRLWDGDAGFLQHILHQRPHHADEIAELRAALRTTADVLIERTQVDCQRHDVVTREIELLAWIDEQCRHPPNRFWRDHAAAFDPLRPPAHTARRLHVGSARGRWRIDAYPRLLARGDVVPDTLLELDWTADPTRFVYCPQGRHRVFDCEIVLQDTRLALSVPNADQQFHLHFDFTGGPR